MCKNHNPRVIDKCMRVLIENLQEEIPCEILACCCGHGRYPMTIIVRNDDEVVDLCSNTIVPRKRRFYKKDKQGYYYVPEVVNAKG